MGQMTKQVFFNAPLEKVWGIWADVQTTPSWVDGVKESLLTSASHEGVGLAWKEKCLFGSQLIEAEHRVSEWQRSQKVTVNTQLPFGATLNRTIDFKANSDGQSEIQIQFDWQLGMVAMMIPDETFHQMLSASFDKTAENWKTRAEN